MDTKEMMEIYERIGTPGEIHRRLAALEGKWETKTKAWMEPGGPPSEGTGTCEQRMLLGGRYLQQEYTGDMMGSTFSGINILGYDNHTKKYVSAWIDSMSTGVYFFEGTGDGDGGTVTQESRYDDPVRGPTIWRSISRTVDDNTIEYEMYLISGDKQDKVMEMTMTRKR